MVSHTSGGSAPATSRPLRRRWNAPDRRCPATWAGSACARRMWKIWRRKTFLRAYRHLHAYAPRLAQFSTIFPLLTIASRLALDALPMDTSPRPVHLPSRSPPPRRSPWRNKSRTTPFSAAGPVESPGPASDYRVADTRPDSPRCPARPPSPHRPPARDVSPTATNPARPRRPPAQPDGRVSRPWPAANGQGPCGSRRYWCCAASGRSPAACCTRLWHHVVQ
jgi:hypothetical protein